MKLGMSLLLVLVVGGGLAACSDFNNSKKSPAPSPVEKPFVEGGDSNPFEPGFDPNSGEFSEEKMVANFGLNIYAVYAREFRREAEALSDRLRELSRVRGMLSEESLTEVRGLWKKTMLAYHRFDAISFGPAQDNGRFLSDNLYSWPYRNLCGIDQEVVKLAASENPNRQLLFTVKGLGALEYLLFEKELKTSCFAGNPSHAPVIAWTQKLAHLRLKDRLNYAAQISSELLGFARRLESAWDPTQQNFTKTLISGGRHALIKDVVNEISDALFSLEILKDQRLARPLGLHKDCLSETGTCPEVLEHPWSEIEFEAIEARLQAARALLSGARLQDGEGFGFVEALTQAGHADVGEKMLRHLDQALTSLRGLLAGPSLKKQIEGLDPAQCRSTTVENRLVEACAFYQDVRQLTTVMKTDFLSVLSLRAPPLHQGDND